MNFHILAKPTGAICNLDCKYCFFKSKEKLYPDSRFRMSEEVLDSYLRQYIAGNQGPEVEIAWQGGEPMLMGVDFFRRSTELASKYAKPGQTVRYTIQTNGTLLNDEWCQFFKEHRFLVGLSLDGPREYHDAYRVSNSGEGSFTKVMEAAQLLDKHQVDFNILASVHAANADYPLEVYRFLRDKVNTPFIQFIPIVQRDNTTGFQEGSTVSEYSVQDEQYGRFLTAIFDEWVQRDVGKTFVQIFDAALGSWLKAPASLCIFSPTCGHALAMEHTGDLYACDHFVEPDYFLGNILEEPMTDLITSENQQNFGRNKSAKLPASCRQCTFRFACHGGCPKDRFIQTATGEGGLNYLCAGYKAFFQHIDRPMRMMAELICKGKLAAEIMPVMTNEKKRCRQTAS